MAYSKQTWNNKPAGGTPISADRLNHIEDGIKLVETEAASRFAPLPAADGTVNQVLAIASLAPLVTTWKDDTTGGGGGGGGDLTEYIGVAVGDELTTVTTGTAKVTFRMPFAMTITGVRANVNTASSSGVVTVDINEGGTTILSTKLTIDANEKTSTTAATAAVVSDTALADDAEITIDVDTAGTGAKGLKVWIIGTRPFS